MSLCRTIPLPAVNIHKLRTMLDTFYTKSNWLYLNQFFHSCRFGLPSVLEQRRLKWYFTNWILRCFLSTVLCFKLKMKYLLTNLIYFEINGAVSRDFLNFCSFVNHTHWAPVTVKVLNNFYSQKYSSFKFKKNYTSCRVKQSRVKFLDKLN